jgi:signal transduction histidine kinase
LKTREGALLLAGAALALTVVDVVRQSQLGTADLGLVFFAVANVITFAVVVSISREPARERLALMVAIWLFVAILDDLAFEWPDSRTATTVWMFAHGLQPAAYAAMVLAYPSGRLRARGERLLVALAATAGLVWMGEPLLHFRGAVGCPSCIPRAASWLYTGVASNALLVGRASWLVFIALGVWFVALLLRRLLSAPRGSRITLLPLGLAVLFAAAEFIAQRVVWLGGWQGPLDVLDWIGLVSGLALPLAILFGLTAIRRRRGPVGDLVVALGSASPGEISASLSRTVGDPTLTLVLWLPDRGEFVDEAGEPVDIEVLPDGRAVTLIGARSEPVAAILHDERLVGQRPLLEAAGSAGRLALENARLQAELRRQLAEVQASRARIVEATDAERRRLERDLHDGAQQRLLALGLALQLLRGGDGDPALLNQAEAELQTALRELRELARGMHPTILSDQGLGPAVRSLADRATIPVAVHSADCRYAPAIEAAAYFLVAEALANVAKHSGASSAVVTLSLKNGQLIVEIGDDGRGGAAREAGGGLQGLTDRIAAVGGTLSITSEPGKGTTLTAEIPCGS